MKAQTPTIAVLLALVAGCATDGAWPSVADQPAYELLGSVTVEPLDISLSADKEAVSKELWDLFANTDLHKRFSEITVPGHADAWSVYSNRLVTIARERPMDAESLSRVLERIKTLEGLPGDSMKVLPYGAFTGRQGDELVWMVTCVWSLGVSYDSDHRPLPQRLGHIKIWAFSADGLEEVGVVNCK